MNANMPLLNRAEFEEENTNLTDVLESMECYVEAFWLHTEEVVSPDGTVILTDEEAAYDNDMDYDANLEHIAYMVTKKAESFTYAVEADRNMHRLVRSDGCATKWSSNRHHTYMDGMVGLLTAEGPKVLTAAEFARIDARRQKNVLFREE